LFPWYLALENIFDIFNLDEANLSVITVADGQYSGRARRRESCRSRVAGENPNVYWEAAALHATVALSRRMMSYHEDTWCVELAG